MSNPGSKITRPSWDEYFMNIAREVARRSTCLRRQLGAILVKDKRILATGYNGAPSNLPHCDEVGCLRQQQGIPSGQRHELCRGLHAEMNALLQAATYGIEARGATLYCTAQPCSLCAKMLINTGVQRVVITGEYPDELASQLFVEAGIKVEHLDAAPGASPHPPAQ